MEKIKVDPWVIAVLIILVIVLIFFLVGQTGGESAGASVGSYSAPASQYVGGACGR